MFGQSKYYVDNLSENVARGQRMKIEKQLWPSRAPNGHWFCDETKQIHPDAEHFRMLRRIFEWFLYGHAPVAEIHRRLREDYKYKIRPHKLRGGRTPTHTSHWNIPNLDIRITPEKVSDRPFRDDKALSPLIDLLRDSVGDMPKPEHRKPL